MMLKHATDAGEAGQRVRHTNQRRQTVANENKGAALITGTSLGITVTLRLYLLPSLRQRWSRQRNFLIQHSSGDYRGLR
jgi:hypothetical protein